MKFDSVLVSITEVCTVGCRHCGFRGSERDREADPEEIARWIRQACDYGVPKIILTGGEPFQRFERVEAAVAAARKHPRAPEVACFTSSIWASSHDAVNRHLARVRGLTHLYLSTDVFHQEKVPPQYVMNVIDVARDHGVRHISLCVTIAKKAEEEQTREIFRDYLDKVLFHVDYVIPTPFLVGIQAAGTTPEPAHFQSTCYLDTPLINPNGDLSACHIGKAGAYVNLSEQVYFLGNLNERSFSSLMDDAEGNYEYQYLRVFGPRGIARMVAQSERLGALFGAQRFTNGCDLCYRVLRTPEARAAFQELVNSSEIQQVVNAARFVRFGEQTAGRLETLSPAMR
ncbi:MAG: radical SAM protein [Bryobacterales bacterium]|nr:radical SAM protein [Bryobacterales bacterium]